jgi:hypothetical protein
LGKDGERFPKHPGKVCKKTIGFFLYHLSVFYPVTAYHLALNRLEQTGQAVGSPAQTDIANPMMPSAELYSNAGLYSEG